MTKALQDAYRLHQAGKIHQAAELYDEILRVHPQNFDALYLLGFARLQLGRPEDAERLFGEAIGSIHYRWTLCAIGDARCSSSLVMRRR